MESLPPFYPVTASPGPLAGLKVIELGHYGSAPLCTMMLADLGADVIKIESPSGDIYRRLPPFQDGESHYFMSINRNKRSAVLDLKKPDDVERFKLLAEASDVLVENMRPGVLDRLGIGYAQLQALNARLVFCSISGYGQTGPMSGEGSHDLIIQALSGMMDATGDSNGSPMKLVPAVPDVLAAYNAAFSIMAGVYGRDQGKRASKIDIALFDSSIYAMSLIYLAQYFGTGKSPVRLGSAHPNIVPLQAYVSGDGQRFVVGASDQRMWRSLCAAIGDPALASDSRFADEAARREHRQALNELLMRTFLCRSRDEWLTAFQRESLPAAPINSLGEAMNSPQALARGMQMDIPHPRLGSIKAVGFAAQFSPNPASVRRPAPALGEHTEEIFREIQLGSAAGHMR